MSCSQTFPLAEFKNRRNALRRALAKENLDSALVCHQPDVFYFSGTAQSAYLLIPVEKPSTIFVHKYLPRAQSETDIVDVRAFTSFADVGKVFRDNGKSIGDIPQIGLEMDVIPLKLFRLLEKGSGPIQWADVSKTIRWIRAQKSDDEIQRVKHAAQLLDLIFEEIPNWIRPGMTELALAANIEQGLRLRGHQGILHVRAFNSSIHFGNVLFGSSGAVRGSFDGPTCGSGLYTAIPKGAGWKQLEIAEPIFIDLVAGVDGYLADATRLFSLGHLNDTLLDAHQHCLDIQQAIVTDLKAGIPCAAPYNRACKMAKSLSIDHVFMGPIDDQARFVGHGLGLEIDEFPVLAPSFTGNIPANCVVAIEPKAIFAGIGAVGIENTWHITKDGAIRLTEYPDACVECPV